MKLTKEELAKVLIDNQDKIIAWIHFEHQAGHVVDIESVAINGDAVQLEVKPFDL